MNLCRDDTEKKRNPRELGIGNDVKGLRPYQLLRQEREKGFRRGKSPGKGIAGDLGTDNTGGRLV